MGGFITTKAGDKGNTNLRFGCRVSKTDDHIEACGCIDELNSSLGLVRANSNDEEINEIILKIQRDLFVLGADLALPSKNRKYKVDKIMVDWLDNKVLHFENNFNLPKDWAIPGSNNISALLDLARTTCRRAERQIVKMKEEEKFNNEFLLMYLNRLSDLLWLSARYSEKKN